MYSTGTFLWDYSGMRVHGIGVLLGPDSGINGIVFCQFCSRYQKWLNRWNSGLFRIASNRVLLAIFTCLSTGKWHTQTSSVSSPWFLSRQLFCFQNSTNSFFWELIFCMFCYSYTRIRIDGIVPKECVLGKFLCNFSSVFFFAPNTRARLFKAGLS